jgi:hypothetical protein
MSLERDASFETPAVEQTHPTSETRSVRDTDEDRSSIGTSELISSVSDVIRRFVVLTDAQTVALALWVLHTHALAAADYTPYLAITSAEKQSGKSTLLDVLTVLAKDAWYTSRTSAGALVRRLHGKEVTLLLDEVDAALGGAQEYTETLRGILNAGFKRGGAYSMCIVTRGGEWSPQDFNVFGPKAFALIGELPETVASRSILIRMRPKLPSDRVERLRSRDAADLAAPVKERLAQWAESAIALLSDARPELPEVLSNRATDVWEPLFAIAEFAGAEWATAARAAAIELAKQDAEESMGVRLLADIRDVFRGNRMSSQELVRLLVAIEESPWGSWSRAWGQSLTPQAFARLLRPYEIGPQPIWFGNDQRKGYHRAAFEDAWARYLPQDGLNTVNGVNTVGSVDLVDAVDGLPDEERDLF